MYLNKLQKILTKNNEKYLFPCIKDLVANGLNLERFSNEENIPSRQDITQYLAAWFKYIGLSSDECREWMNEYCVEELSAISSSSKSRIRHSTKSNIKYVYKSDVIFDCRCEINRFKAHCEQTCSIYEEMAHKAKESEITTIVESYDTVGHRIEDEIVLKNFSAKHEYKDQFEKAMEFAQHHLKQQTSRKEVVNLLNDSGYKTRTGKKWSTSILGHELKKFQREKRRKKGEKEDASPYLL